MRRIVLLIFVFGCICMGHCTAETSFSKIFISAVLPATDDLPAEAARQLDLKLNQLLMHNGIAEAAPDSRFVLTSKVSVLTKDIVAGPPQKVAVNVDFTFIVGDVVENKKFESTTLRSVGVGVNETKAFIAAVNNIKSGNPELIQLIKNAKKEIESYYSHRCEEILKEAAQEAGCRNYERAIYLLMHVPDVCECAERCQDMAVEYSEAIFNDRAEQLLNQARALWAASPDADGAAAVADIIDQFPSFTPSQSSMDKLVNEITEKLKSDQKKEWEFKLKQYNDRIAKEKRDDQARLEQLRADNLYREQQQTADNAYRTRQQIADNQYRSAQQTADNAYRTRQQMSDNQYRTVQQTVDNENRRVAIEVARQIGMAYAKNHATSSPHYSNVSLW